MSKFTRLLLTCLCLSVAVMGTSPAFAAKKKKSKTKATTSSHVMFPDRASERDKDREVRRLMRECKGQVNAGACAGYTR